MNCSLILYLEVTIHVQQKSNEATHKIIAQLGKAHQNYYNAWQMSSIIELKYTQKKKNQVPATWNQDIWTQTLYQQFLMNLNMYFLATQYQ